MSASTAIKTWKDRMADRFGVTLVAGMGEKVESISGEYKNAEIAELRTALEAAEQKLAQPDIWCDAALAAVEKIRPVTWTINRADFVDGPDYKGTEAEHWSVSVEDHPDGMFLYRHEVIAVLKGGEARPLPVG